MRRCEICNIPYDRGTMIDIGVGYIQVSEDTPACDCEEKEYLELYHSENEED